jgi:hypothetical protein
MGKGGQRTYTYDQLGPWCDYRLQFIDNDFDCFLGPVDSRPSLARAARYGRILLSYTFYRAAGQQGGGGQVGSSEGSLVLGRPGEDISMYVYIGRRSTPVLCLNGNRRDGA